LNSQLRFAVSVSDSVRFSFWRFSFKVFEFLRFGPLFYGVAFLVAFCSRISAGVEVDRDRNTAIN
jgi:hypothetical protein